MSCRSAVVAIPARMAGDGQRRASERRRVRVALGLHFVEIVTRARGLLTGTVAARTLPLRLGGRERS
jgi:hypothetical protein